MTEAGILAALKHILVPVGAAILGVFGWMGKVIYKRVSDLERNYSELDKKQAVQESQLKEIKQDIHSIDKKLDKIIHKMFDDDRRYGQNR